MSRMVNSGNGQQHTLLNIFYVVDLMGTRGARDNILLACLQNQNTGALMYAGNGSFD